LTTFRHAVLDALWEHESRDYVTEIRFLGELSDAQWRLLQGDGLRCPGDLAPDQAKLLRRALERDVPADELSRDENQYLVTMRQHSGQDEEPSSDLRSYYLRVAITRTWDGAIHTVFGRERLWLPTVLHVHVELPGEEAARRGQPTVGH
jgi:hypothetical protein